MLKVTGKFGNVNADGMIISKLFLKNQSVRLSTNSGKYPVALVNAANKCLVAYQGEISSLAERL